MIETVELTADIAGIRLDKFIAGRVPELSRVHVRELIDNAQVTVNGHTVKPSHPLKIGDKIDIAIPPPPPSAAAPHIPVLGPA